MANPFFVTTAIFYANAPLHVGSAFEVIGADVMARYRRLRGDDVYFLTGMDEHGEKNQIAAERLGITPQRHVDDMAAGFKEFCELLLISHDDVIRTTEPRHKRAVEAFWRRVRDQGDIYLGSYSGAYCGRCESYVTESDLKDGRCPACGDPTRELREPAYFFRASKYQAPLLRFYAEHPEFAQPDFRRNEMLRMLESGLEDTCVSRSSVQWGIPVPDAPGHVIYVWFDALVNYISAIGYAADEAKFARYWPAALHVVGKDIMRFHVLLWPAMLMAAGLPLPRQVFGHGFIYVKGAKMSKSLGNVVAPRDIAAKYGAEALRYFLMRDTPYALDGNYSEDSLRERFNRDLGNDLGNLAMRTFSMIERYRGGIAPRASGPPALAETAEAVLRETPPLMDAMQFSRAPEQIWGLARRANQFVEERKPWELAKDKSRAERLDATLYELAETVRLLSVWVSPFLPRAAAALREQLSLPPLTRTLDEEGRWGLLPAESRARRGAPLFPRVEEKPTA